MPVCLQISLYVSILAFSSLQCSILHLKYNTRLTALWSIRPITSQHRSTAGFPMLYAARELVVMHFAPHLGIRGSRFEGQRDLVAGGVKFTPPSFFLFQIIINVI